MTDSGPERARRDLSAVLADGRVEMAEAQARMAELGHPAGRIDKARRALEVKTTRQGAPGTRQTFHWELPTTTCPLCCRPYGPVTSTQPGPWPMQEDGNTDYWRVAEVSNETRTMPMEPRRVVVERVPLEPSGPPRCDRCGMAAAADRGQPCPYWPNGRRCMGTLR